MKPRYTADVTTINDAPITSGRRNFWVTGTATCGSSATSYGLTSAREDGRQILRTGNCGPNSASLSASGILRGADVAQGLPSGSSGRALHEGQGVKRSASSAPQCLHWG